MNIQAINLELAKIGYKAVKISDTRDKVARVPWPLGPKKRGAPRFKSRCYGHIIGASTASKISAEEFAQIKNRSDYMFGVPHPGNPFA